MKNICVYASSSEIIDKTYFEQAGVLAELMAKKGWGLIFGAGMLGLMGAMADGMIKNGGKITGVIPELLNVKNVVHENCNELFVTKTMRERKMLMEEKSDAFIALPGGFGTLEELLEIITLKQLKYHKKPVVILNINHYYDCLNSLFDHVIQQKFAKEESSDLYFFAGSPQEAIDYIEKYTYKETGIKWFSRTEE